MKVRGIIKDSLKYPLSDWKKFLILGIIFLLIYILNLSANYGKNEYLMVLLIGIAFIVGLFVNGYIFKIIDSTFDGKIELPEFKNWLNMVVEGAKVYIVSIVYLIPFVFLIILLYFGAPVNGMNNYDFINVFNSVFWQGINSFIYLFMSFGFISINHSESLGILYIIILYSFIITPIPLMAIANMVLDDGDLKSAFKIREILWEISVIGWANLIKWYILTGIIFMILMGIGNIIFLLFYSIGPIIIEIVSVLLIYPYFSLFLARSIALFYMPEE